MCFVCLLSILLFAATTEVFITVLGLVRQVVSGHFPCSCALLLGSSSEAHWSPRRYLVPLHCVILTLPVRVTACDAEPAPLETRLFWEHRHCSREGPILLNHTSSRFSLFGCK